MAGFICDICGVSVENSDGHHISTAETLSSRNYWEYRFKEKDDITEESLGFLIQIQSADQSGYKVCNSCDNFIKADLNRVQTGGAIEAYMVAKVAGSVWEDNYGNWPSSVQFETTSSNQTGSAPNNRKSDTSSCFVATVVFENPYCYELLILRNFRDRILLNYSYGIILIAKYYKFGPRIAITIKNNNTLKLFTKLVLRIIVYFCRILLNKEQLQSEK